MISPFFIIISYSPLHLTPVVSHFKIQHLSSTDTQEEKRLYSPSLFRVAFSGNCIKWAPRPRYHQISNFESEKSSEEEEKCAPSYPENVNQSWRGEENTELGGGGIKFSFFSVLLDFEEEEAFPSPVSHMWCCFLVKYWALFEPCSQTIILKCSFPLKTRKK